METALARFIVTFFDLVEAEGRSLRQSTFRLGAGLLVAVAAMAAGVGAIVLIGAGIFLAVLPAAGAAVAAFVTSAYALVITGACAWAAIRISR